jgi:aspartate racemase
MVKPLLFFLLLALVSCNSREYHQTLTELGSKTDKNMQALGLIGGTSWHSTIDYYRVINQAVNVHFGNNTNPPLSIYTLNQAEVHRLQKENKWDSIATMFMDAGLRLQAGGAEALLFCANTPHKVYDQVDDALELPIIHIADATSKAIKTKGIQKVGFIGTKFTMQEDFITGRIRSNEIEVILPKDDATIDELHRIIIDELTYDNIIPSSKEYVLKVLQGMISEGAQGVVLGCTEFPLMIFQEDLDVPVFNTSELHAQEAIAFILSQNPSN